jgi:hypothetical protein
MVSFDFAGRLRMMGRGQDMPDAPDLKILAKLAPMM